jgi:hypothetical protein
MTGRMSSGLGLAFVFRRQTQDDEAESCDEHGSSPPAQAPICTHCSLNEPLQAV